MRPRKDYGCPLRIYADAEWSGVYYVLPPRSARAAERYRTRYGWQSLFHSGRTTNDAWLNAGPHLGQRIIWAELPAAVQRAVRASFLGEYCPREV